MTRALLLLLAALALRAGDAPDLRGLAADDQATRLTAISALAESAEPRLATFLDDYRQGSAYLWNGRIVLVPSLSAGSGIPLDPITRAPLAAATTALVELTVNRKERLAASDAATRLRLADPDTAVRLAAAVKAGDTGGAANRSALASMVAHDGDARVVRAAHEGVSIIDLAEGQAADRIVAARTLGELRSSRALDLLESTAHDATDPVLRKTAAIATGQIRSRQTELRIAQTLFSGLSSGSILVVMALGLAITFGLMGVINMAHGEMLMIGAYATLAVQWGFRAWLPAAWQPFDLLLGLPAGFLAAAIVGWLLELTVIRHLYGRPLETLLATWGISYLLIQMVRVAFGDNQAVTAPGWLVGGWEPVTDLVLPWNRLFIILVTVLSVVAVWLLIGRTRLGLLLRATTQSRRTAAGLGVDVRRIDGLTFALGSGLAGAAGCALTLIGGLKPDMGQEYIIDSFLVVATGGVGNLGGVVWAGLGLGVANKVLEPFTQAVWAKVLVLGMVMLFLQWRPQGLFPPRGRLADG